MRIVHPATSRSIAGTLRIRPARLRAPSRLPSLVPTQPNLLRRILRMLGLAG